MERSVDILKMTAIAVTANVIATDWRNSTDKMHCVEIEAGSEAKDILLTTQYIMTIIGSVANLAALLVLCRSASTFSPIYLYLLKVQAAVDLLICVCGTAVVLQTPSWTTGNAAFDTALCHIWHGQFLYFTLVFYSIWNLVIIAYERYQAICKPFSHSNTSLSKVHKLSVLLVVVSILADFPALLQIRMEDGVCVSEYLIPGDTGNIFYSVVGFWYFVVYYSGPTVIFCILYGKVTMKLVKRREASGLGESQLINSAARQMTQTAMAVTGIFILSMSWDFWYYLLGRVGLVSYVKNTILQLVGIWLSALNSIANPFVYMILLPAFRRSAVWFFCRCMNRNSMGRTPTESDVSTVTTAY